MNNQEKENQTIDKEHLNKIIRIVVAILAAIALWLYVDQVKQLTVTTTARNIPVEFAGEHTTLADNGFMLLSGYDTTVDLTLKGPRSVLWNLDKKDIRIVADTSTIQDTGIQTLDYQVVYPDNIQRSQITEDHASIYAITVTVGELFDKKVPIYCDVAGSVAQGFVAENVLLDPGELVLRAQRDDLLNVSYARVAVDVNGATETVINTVEYELYDYNDILIENENIRAESKLIQVTVPVKTVKDVPVRLNFVEATGSTMDSVTYSYDPAVIRLKGDGALLDTIDEMVLGTVYLQDLEEYQTLTYEVSIPEGTELVSESNVITVTIVVEGVSERRVSSSNFATVNAPEGYTPSVVTESLSVLLRGLTAQVNAVTPEQVKITADLSEVKEAGSFTVPATVEIEGHQDVGVKGSYQVIVNVEPTPPAPAPNTPAENG